MNITFKYLYFLKQCFTVCANVLSLKFDKDGSCLLEINSVIIQASGNNSQQYFCIIIARFSTYIWTTYLMMKKMTIAFTTTQRIKKGHFSALHQTFYNSYLGLTSLDLYRNMAILICIMNLLSTEEIYHDYLRVFPVHFQWVLLNVLVYTALNRFI